MSREGAARARRPDLAIILALALLTIAVYSGVGSFEFANYDDNDYVYANPFVAAGVTSGGVVKAFTSGHAANWHPLTWMSHMVDVDLFGLDAKRHHVVNLSLHVVNVLLLFHALTALTASRWRSAIVATLFAIHPLNVETVAWISERKSLLSTMAWLLAISAYARWTRDKRRRDFWLLVAFFVAGLLCKPMIVTLPATLLVLDIWPLRRINVSRLSSLEGLREAWPVVAEKLPLFALSAVSSLVTYSVQAAWNAVGSVEAIPLAERLLNAAISLRWYVEKTFVPAGLCVIYPHPSILGSTVSRLDAWISIAAIAALFAVAIRWRRAQPALVAGLSWYVVTLLPVLGIVQVGVQAHADRYAYVPLIGIFTAVVWLLADGAAALGAGRIAAAAAAIVVAALAWVAHGQTATWHDSETLFAHALKVTGGNNPIARNNLASHYTELGLARKQSGDPAAALTYVRAAVEIHPSADSLYNHAAVLSDLGRYPEAIPLYQRSLALDPTRADAWLNLGDAQVVTGDLRAACVSYGRTLRLRPDKYADYGLAYAAAKTGDVTTASAAFDRLQREDPRLALDLQRLLSR